ncbi:complement decay-accelerating factor isoform X2 [Thunnus albacares]|uniref:complement decay-accelerating factor isoform X2 n=1 Tax=Thunnus albacares TaxID=8236 RepID=UPI001CF67207|nr:complement decay-accelerating factor isoform X2 [Thunnus albacares]
MGELVLTGSRADRVSTLPLSNFDRRESFSIRIFNLPLQPAMEVLLDTCGRQNVKSLLLLTLCLFLWKAAADCPRPEGGENTVLTDEALLMNSFEEGTKVTLECANGYEQESGSGSMRCIGGNWSEPDLTCKKRDCGLPKAQPHMSFDTSGGTLFGATIRVICDEGYQIRGPSYKQCFARGWTGKPKCEIITCDKPGNVTNGKHLWEVERDPEYQEIIQYVCNDGYTLIGSDHIMCSETGEYDPQPPECKENVFISVTTEDRITTHVVTPTPTPPTQEASTTTEAPHRDKTITASTVSPSARGGKDIMTAEDKSTKTSITSTTPSTFPDLGKHDTAVDANKNTDYAPVIISVIAVVTVVIIFVFVIHKFFLRRKGTSCAVGSSPI